MDNSKFTEFERKQLEVEMKMHQVWSPHAGQAPICYALFQAGVQFIFMQCGRKFGKTEFEIYCMYLWAMLFPDSQIYYIADTMKHAGELIWKNGRLPRFFLTLKKLRGETDQEFALRRAIGAQLHDEFIDRPNNADMRIIFRNGSFIKCDGAENFANADGIEPNMMVYDEYKHHDPRYHEAMEPNLKVKKAPLLIVGTPPDNKENNYCKTALSFKRQKNGLFVKRPSYMNPIMYPEGINDPEFIEERQKYEARGDWDVFQREYMAEIVLGGSKSIFPMFVPAERDDITGEVKSHSKHVRPHVEIEAQLKTHPKDWEYFVTYDAGTTTCFAVLFGALNKHTKKVLLLDEMYVTDQHKTSTKQIFPLSREKWRTLHPIDDDWHKEYDYAAAWFATEVAHEYDEHLSLCTKDLKNKEVKLGMIKDMYLTDGMLLEVSDRCRNFSNETVNYHKDDKGKIPKENDHLLDCFRYMLNAMYYDTVPNLLSFEDREDEPRFSTMEQDILGFKNLEDYL